MAAEMMTGTFEDTRFRSESKLKGPEYATKYKTLICLTGAASAKVIDDIALCMFEAVKVRVQTQPGFARGLGGGLPKFVKFEGALGVCKGLMGAPNSVSGKGLSLHELSCWAFSQAIDLVPTLLGSVSNYFKFAPAPFERIMSEKWESGLMDKDGIHYLNVVRTSLRLLLADSEIFTTLWDWSFFLDFVHQCAVLKHHSKPEYIESVSDIRWCTVQILSVVLKISEKVTAAYGLGPKEVFASLLRYVLSFSLGDGPVHALLLPKIFPSSIRAKVVAL